MTRLGENDFLNGDKHIIRRIAAAPFLIFALLIGGAVFYFGIGLMILGWAIHDIILLGREVLDDADVDSR